MVHVEISADQLDRARRLYPFRNLPGSIMGGRSNIYGAAGEIIIWDQYKEICEYAGNFDYDLIINGETVDVKTKQTTVEPLPHYSVSIADPRKTQDPSTQQKCDWYCFVRVHAQLIDSWVLGWIRPEEFFKRAVYGIKGDADPIDPNFFYKENCWNLPISDLYDSFE